MTPHDMSGPDSPLQRATRSAAQQAQRARRAETVRLRQRAALLALMAKTMAELQISMAELGEARRALVSPAPSPSPPPPPFPARRTAAGS